MKRTILTLATLFLASSTGLAQVGGDGSSAENEAGTLMVEAARRFLGSLDDARRAKATFAFDDPERLNWHWIPRPRKGIPIKELAPDQRPLAFGLLNTGLSDKGSITASTTMSYEEIIRAEEKGTGPIRDSELYYVSVFGTPGQGKWGWRWEGHHLSLNFTLDGAKFVSATPFMFGSNPAKVVSGANQGLRNLAEIQDPIYSLVATLNADQKKSALISMDVPDVPSSPNADAAKPLPAGADGLDINSLDDSQKQFLIKALRAYVRLFPGDISEDLVEKVKAGGGKGHFAWYGPMDPSKPHAFRLQGPTVLIDFNNYQNNGNHIHTFYRNYEGDFGGTAAK